MLETLNHRNGRRVLVGATLTAALATALFYGPAGDAQVIIRPGRIGLAPAVAANGPGTGADANDKSNDLEMNGAGLDTDQDIDSAIGHAKERVQGGQYPQAIKILQSVIEQSDEKLSTTDGKTYRPIREIVEDLIADPAAMGPDGLRAYRLYVDGDAKAKLDDPNLNREAALTQVVRKWFLSSYGDAAAYELGCRAMDRGDWGAARRMFMKVTQKYPDPKVDLVRAQARLAVASARLGDAPGAAVAVEALARSGKAGDVLAGVRGEVARSLASLSTGAGPGDGTWSGQWGNSRHEGHMREVPADQITANSRWTETWVYSFELSADSAMNPMVKAAILNNGNRQKQDRATLLSRWEQGQWLPAGNLAVNVADISRTDAAGEKRVISRTQLIFKSHKTVMAVDADTGKLMWPGPAINETPNQAYGPIYFTGPMMFNPNAPQTPEEVMLFGDRLDKSVALWDNTVFYIEDQGYAGAMGMRMMRGGGQQQVTPGNVMTAVDALTGKLVWRAYTPGKILPRDNRDGKELEKDGAALFNAEARFVGLPVPCGDRVLIPVESNNALYLQARNARTGELTWNTKLCDAPINGGSPWSPVAVSVDGSEAYVCSGRGAVFSVDGADGTIRWATRYERSKPDANTEAMMRGWGGMRPTVTGQGWDEDTIITHNDVLLAFPSDSDRFYGLDRQSGEVVFVAQRDAREGKMRYVLGVLGEKVYVAGSNMVRAFNIAPVPPSPQNPRGSKAAGRIAWESTKFETALGRGCLTSTAINIPLRDRVLQIDPEGLKLKNEIKVAVNPGYENARDPLGNLYTDGGRIFAQGMNVVYAFADSNTRLAMYDKIIAGGGDDAAAAYLSRGRLRGEVGRLADSVEDFRQASKLLKDPAAQSDAKHSLYEGLLSLARAEPDHAPDLLKEAQDYATTPGEQTRILLARGDDYAAKDQVNEALDVYLQVAGDTHGGMNDLGADQPGAQAMSTMIGAAAIRSLAEKKPDQVIAALQERSKAALATAVGASSGATSTAGRVDPLVAVVRSFPLTPAAVDAARLAARAAREGVYGYDRTKPEDPRRPNPEYGELILRDLMLTSHKPTAAAALAALADYHLEMAQADRAAHQKTNTGQDDWSFRQATVEYDQLAKQYPGVTVGPSEAPAPAEQYAAAGLAKVADAGRIAPVVERGPDQPLVFAWDMSSQPQQGQGMFLIDTNSNDDPTQFTRDHALILQPNGAIACRQVRGGRLSWTLPLPQGLMQQQAMYQPAAVGFNPFGQPYPALMRDANVALVFEADKITAYGLLNGTMLWNTSTVTSSKTAAGEVSVNQGQAIRAQFQGGGLIMVDGEFPNAGMQPGTMAGRIASGDGLVTIASIDKDLRHEVRAVDTGTGRLRWRRRFDLGSVDSVNSAGGFVNLLMNAGKEVVTLDRYTGRKLGGFNLPQQFNQPMPQLAWTDSGVLINEGANVVLRAYATGKAVWTHPGVTNINRLGLLGGSVVYILHENQQKLTLLDLSTGSTKVNAYPATQADHFNSVLDVALSADGLHLALTGMNNQGQMQGVMISLKPGENGQPTLRHEGPPILFGQQNGQVMQARVLAEAGDAVPFAAGSGPMMMYEGRRGGIYRNGVAMQQGALSIFSKTTGKPIDIGSLRTGSTRLSMIYQAPMILAGHILVAGPEGIVAYTQKEDPGAATRPAAAAAPSDAKSEAAPAPTVDNAAIARITEQLARTRLQLAQEQARAAQATAAGDAVAAAIANNRASDLATTIAAMQTALTQLQAQSDQVKIRVIEAR